MPRGFQTLSKLSFQRLKTGDSSLVVAGESVRSEAVNLDLTLVEHLHQLAILVALSRVDCGGGQSRQPGQRLGGKIRLR